MRDGILNRSINLGNFINRRWILMGTYRTTSLISLSSKTTGFFWFAFDRNNPTKNKPGKKLQSNVSQAMQTHTPKFSYFWVLSKLAEKCRGRSCPRVCLSSCIDGTGSWKGSFVFEKKKSDLKTVKFSGNHNTGSWKGCLCSKRKRKYNAKKRNNTNCSGVEPTPANS